VGACLCRKPAPGLLRQAARVHAIDLANSWMIGDILDDVEAGRRAGCRSVLLDVGNETEWQLSPLRTPHVRAANLLEAARAIVASDLQAEQEAAAAEPASATEPSPPGVARRGPAHAGLMKHAAGMLGGQDSLGRFARLGRLS
jgi:hypothetical protein